MQAAAAVTRHARMQRIPSAGVSGKACKGVGIPTLELVGAMGPGGAGAS